MFQYLNPTQREMNQAMAEAKLIPHTTDLHVDELYFSALFDADALIPISDEKYADELQLQEALFISSATLPSDGMPSSRVPEAEIKSENKYIGECSRPVTRLLTPKEESVHELSSETFCSICLDYKPTAETFTTSSSCSHSFCNDCIARYISEKMKESYNMAEMKCPNFDCRAVVMPEKCKNIVPEEVFNRWEAAVTLSSILDSERYYCPFKDCSELLVDDGGTAVVMAECPYCHRMFCAKCKVAPWHDGMTCEEFQELDGKNREELEEILALKLVRSKEWRRCPYCKFVVEKNLGCDHIRCRCGHEFCYRCGNKWDVVHHCV